MKANKQSVLVDDAQDDALLRAWRAVPVPVSECQSQEGAVDDHDKMRDDEPLNAQEKVTVEETITRARAEAASVNAKLKGEGTLGAGIDIELETPVIPWLDVLRTALVSIPAKTSRAWRPIARRAFGAFSSYQPGRAGTAKALDTLTLMIDTSGSMGEFLGTAGADVMELIATMSPRILEIVFYDDGICGRRTVERRRLREVELTRMVGGGGTSVIRALQQLTSAGAVTTPVVVLTDGLDDFQLPAPLIARLGEVIWCAYTADIAPNYGRAIRIDTD